MWDALSKWRVEIKDDSIRRKRDWRCNSMKNQPEWPCGLFMSLFPLILLSPTGVLMQEQRQVFNPYKYIDLVESKHLGVALCTASTAALVGNL